MKALDIFKIKYPFKVIEDSWMDCSGEMQSRTVWIGGCNTGYEAGSTAYGPVKFYECHGEGWLIFEVLAVTEMPRKYQDRVLYRITLIDPDGGERKKNDIHCVTKSKFKRMISGYPHEYEVV